MTEEQRSIYQGYGVVMAALDRLEREGITIHRKPSPSIKNKETVARVQDLDCLHIEAWKEIVFLPKNKKQRKLIEGVRCDLGKFEITFRHYNGMAMVWYLNDTLAVEFVGLPAEMKEAA